MASDLVRFTIAIPEKLLNEFDRQTSQRGLLVNRSEAMRNLIRDALVEMELQDPAADVAGSITLVYDPRTTDLVRRVDEVARNYPQEVIASTRSHLDQGRCLEVVAVRGKAYKVDELANCLLGIKGMLYGKLCVTTGNERLGD